MDSLTLNGKTYNGKALQVVCKKKLASSAAPDWEQGIYRFIQEWVSEDAIVKVKSSGSTGKPKTIAIHRSQMEYSSRMTGKYLGLKNGDTALLCLSADYIAGKMMIARAFTLGLNLLVAKPVGNPLEEIPTDITIDFTAMVPYQLKALLGLNNARLNERIGRIGNILLGGAAVSRELRQALKEYPNNIYETFGMTETVSHIALKKLSGKASEYFETIDSSIILGQDDRDCLVIISPELFSRPVITNDVVELKDESHFKWLGRVDNVINSGGIKILAEDLEHRISHIFDNRFFVAGIPDTELGQKLVLLIEAANYTAAKENKIFDAMRKLLSRYEVPKEIYYVPHFNEAANHKVNRKTTLASITSV